MEPIWLPPPEAVVGRLVEIASEGYRDSPSGSISAIRCSA
jgi:hypothetical protein